jgi:hypothetical protein
MPAQQADLHSSALRGTRSSKAVKPSMRVPRRTGGRQRLACFPFRPHRCPPPSHPPHQPPTLLTLPHKPHRRIKRPIRSFSRSAQYPIHHSPRHLHRQAIRRIARRPFGCSGAFALKGSFFRSASPDEFDSTHALPFAVRRERRTFREQDRARTVETRPAPRLDRPEPVETYAPEEETRVRNKETAAE